MSTYPLPTRRATTNAVSIPASTSSWLLNGPCRDEDPELFFPLGDSDKARQATRDAKAVCAGCPVREMCLDWAVNTNQRTGVWGGLSELERMSLYTVASETQFSQCVARQEYIEKRRAVGVSQRAIAAELGVARKTLRRALAFFEMERNQLDEAAAVAA